MSQKKIGAKIVIDGEQEFRAALNQSKQAMKEFDSEMKLVTAQFKDNEKSMEALKSKQEVYQKQQQELTKQSKILVEQIQKANEAYKKAEDAQAKQAEKIKKLESALAKAKDEYGDSADEVKELEKELADANEEYEKQERSITQLSNKISRWNTDLNKTETELVECDRALKNTNDAIDNYGKEVDQAEDETRQFGIVMNDAGNNTEKLRVSLGSLVSAQVVVDVLRQAAHAIAEVATAAIDVGMKFEASMSNVQALSGATGDDLEALTAKAKEMGAQTIYSASESADAFSYMALAGWDAKQMLDGIEPVLNLAAAANMDLAEASDIVTDYITAFGLKAEDAAHFSDAMAVAMSTSNTTVEQLGEAYKNCAATCGAMGIEMEDATAVLATMANAGVKGGEAGTALNAILTRLATNTKGAADKLEKYGIEVFDAQGNMNSLSSILNGLGNMWGTLSDKEQAALAKTIAGVSHYSKFQTIMLGVSDAAKEGGQSFDDYAAALRDCEGAAEDMAKVMQDNLQGDITILKSALEGLGIATEGVFDESFRTAVQGATDAIGRLQDNIEHGDLGVSLSGLSDAFGELAANIIEGTEEALPGMIDGLAWLIKHLPEITDFIGVAAAAYLTYEGATLAATIATEGLTVALDANPVGLIAGAIAVCVAGLYELVDVSINATDEFEEMAKEAVKGYNNISDAVSKNAESNSDYINTLSVEEEYINSLVKELDDLNSKESLSESEKQRLADIVSELNTRYEDLNLQINDETGKLEDNTGAWKDNVEAQMRQAQVAAIQDRMTEAYAKQYDAQMNVFEIQGKLKKIEEEHGAELEELTKLYDENTEASQANIDRKYELEQSLGGVVAEYNALNDSLDTAQAALDEENASIDQMNQYLGENETKINAATEATQAYNGAVEDTIELTEQQIKEIDELGTAVDNSIEGALNLTEKWKAEWKTSTDEMVKNVQSQIDGVTEWAENLEKLANSSKVAIDQNVMKYLTEMGTEGAGLVKQLTEELEKSPEKVQGFSDKIAEYLSLSDQASSAITDSYIEVMQRAQEGAADAIKAENSPITEAYLETLLEGMEQAGKEAPEALATALEDNAGAVTTAANTVGEEVINGISDKTGANGEKVKELTEKCDKAGAEGLKTGELTSAAETVAQETYDALANKLTESAGTTIGNNFMGAIASAVDARGELLLAAARKYAEEAKNIMDNVKPPTDPNTPPGHADGLAYVPYDNYLARLHEGERILTKEENKEYSALLGNIKMPSFNVTDSRLGDMAEGRAVVINNDIKVDGAQDPEAWTQTFIRTLKREARMA